KLKAIRLFQNVLTFHLSMDRLANTKEDHKTAYLDADLARLQFAHAHAFGENKATRYKAALKQFVQANAGHELSAMARHRWAAVLNGENEKVEARKIALEGKNAYPNSNGGKLCANLALEIEAKSVQVT